MRYDFNLLLYVLVFFFLKELCVLVSYPFLFLDS